MEQRLKKKGILIVNCLNAYFSEIGESIVNELNNEAQLIDNEIIFNEISYNDDLVNIEPTNCGDVGDVMMDITLHYIKLNAQ